MYVQWLDNYISELANCVSGTYPAYFGGGTKLTVVGKNKNIIMLLLTQTLTLI